MENEVRQTQGNYLGKARRNFYITQRCWWMLHQLSTEIGINHSGVLELAVRMMYRELLGEPAPISYPDMRRKRGE